MRSAMPPPAWRWMPIVARIAVGRVVASRSPSATIRSTGRPRDRARRARAGTRGCARGTRPSRACARAMNVLGRARRGGRPRASGRAPARRRCPGSGARCSSAWRRCACAPGRSRRGARRCLRAASDELPDVVVAGERVRAPEQDQLARARTPPGPCRRWCRSCSAGRRGPAIEQMVMRAATRRARSRAARRRGPRGPGGSRACRSPGTARSPRRRARRATACSRSAISPSASSQRDPLEPALALGADAPQRVQEPVGRARVLEVARHLRAQRAARERVLGVAAQLHGLAVASTVTTQLQPSGQSSGQAPGTSRSIAR